MCLNIRDQTLVQQEDKEILDISFGASFGIEKLKYKIINKLVYKIAAENL